MYESTEKMQKYIKRTVMIMKKTSIISLIALMAAVSSLSACKADEARSAEESTAPVMSKVMATANEPDEYAVHPAAAPTSRETAPEETGAETSAETVPETTAETSFTGFKDIHAVTPEELAALYADNGWDESTVIHLPIQTASADFEPIEPVEPAEPIETVTLDPSELETVGSLENLGEFKDDSYWERMLDGDNKKVSNKVFLLCADADTTDAMMQEVIDRYGLEVIYDYENFNMYALAVPEPLDAEQSEKFMNELLGNYSFILSVEPDSVVYLDTTDTVENDMLF